MCSLDYLVYVKYFFVELFNVRGYAEKTVKFRGNFFVVSVSAGSKHIGSEKFCTRVGVGDDCRIGDLDRLLIDPGSKI